MPHKTYNTITGSKIGIWLDELPQAAMVDRHTLVRLGQVEASTRTVKARRAAIELIRPPGPSSYGLLGGEFESSDEGALHLIIPADPLGPARTLERSRAWPLDHVMVGGASEYVPALLSSLEGLGRQALPSGTLRISCMAHGAVGSSRVVFGSLMRALVRLLMREEIPRSAEEALVLLAE